MPRSHVELSRALGWTAEHFRYHAGLIGPTMQQVLISRHYEPQSYRSCQGVLSLTGSYGADRLEAAAARLQINSKAGYQRLKNVLEKRLDELPAQPEFFTPPEHDNIRGATAYE